MVKSMGQPSPAAVKAFLDAGYQECDWHLVTNDYRRAAMKAIVGQVRPAFNMDDVHRAWYGLTAWPDFPDFSAALNRLKRRYPVVSFTMLPLAMVVAVSRRNGIDWDAVISCEMIGVYKPQPEAYARAAAWLGREPDNILMVACHNFDLNAARASGYRTAFVRRPQEWGPAGPPDPDAHPDCSFVVDDFSALAQKLGA